ncbi:AI-2E family transporter [Marivita sp.]|uniref:AI-2E family transporter n=1 Tax=Marivita sp. TaxID=2003365 RepID=UPI003F6F8F6B
MPDTPQKDWPDASRLRIALWFLGLLLAIVLIFVMRIAGIVLVPIVFAVLITLLVAPLDRCLKRLLPGWLAWGAHLLVMLVLIASLTLLFGALYFAAQQAIEALPAISDEIDALVPGQGADDREQTSELVHTLREVWGSAGSRLGEWLVGKATSIATGAATMTGAFLSALLIVFFIVMLALTELPRWSAKTADLLSPRDLKAWDTMKDVIAMRLRRFLLVRTGIGLIQAALYAGWLALFGLDLLVVWAVLTFVLTYIPNLGSLISGILPVLYAFLALDPVTAFWVGVGIFAIEQVVGNLIDPLLQGHQIVLSPTVILVSLLFWGWLWGVAGAFLSTPMMLCLLVACLHVPALRPVSLFLSNQDDLESLDAALGR